MRKVQTPWSCLDGVVSRVFSFLAIIVGAVMIAVEKRLVAILMILCANFGAILGGAYVAVFMILVLIGGVLALFEKPKSDPATDSS